MASPNSSTQLTELMKSCITPNILSSNTLGSAFEPHMSIYIDAQNKYVLIFVIPYLSDKA